MKAATLAVACVFMTLALALSASGFGYDYSYVPYHGGYQSNPLGIGQGGLLMLFGFLFLFLILFGNNNFFNRNTTSGPSVSIVQG